MPTILYIEDNEANRQLVQLIIARRPQLKLLLAETGTAGLELARERQPDLILLDISLPDINGDQVLTTLKQEAATSEIPVIALSGNPPLETRNNYPGFQDYLAKPINISALYSAIDNLLPPG